MNLSARAPRANGGTLRRGRGRSIVRGVESDYLIRAAGEADLALLARWRGQPHVRRWWGDPAVEPEAEKLAEPRIAMWVVEHASRPFGFIQDYDIHAWTPHPFDYLPPSSRGLDLYIGEADMIGHGHGARMLRQHVEWLFRQGAPAAGIDPHPDNLAARRAFEKAGFKVAQGPLTTPWGYALLMDQRAGDSAARRLA